MPPSINRSYANFVADDSRSFVGLNEGIRRDFVGIREEPLWAIVFKGFQDFAYRMGARYTKEPILLALINAGPLMSLVKTKGDVEG